MNEISVKTLYPDGSTSPYCALALPAFASLCLMAGALLVLFRTWDELAVPRWALVLAAALGISRAGAYQLLNTGTFPTLRIGKRLLVPKDKLIEWIEQNTGGGHVGG